VLLEEPVRVRLATPEVPDFDCVSVAHRKHAATGRKADHSHVFERVLLEHTEFVPEDVEELDLVAESHYDVYARGVESNRHWRVCKELLDDGFAPDFVGVETVDAHDVVFTCDGHLLLEEADVQVEDAALGVFRNHVLLLEFVVVLVFGVELQSHDLVVVCADYKLAISQVGVVGDFDDVGPVGFLDGPALHDFERLVLILDRIHEQNGAVRAACKEFLVVLKQFVHHQAFQVFVLLWEEDAHHTFEFAVLVENEDLRGGGAHKDFGFVVLIHEVGVCGVEPREVGNDLAVDFLLVELALLELEECDHAVAEEGEEAVVLGVEAHLLDERE